VSLSQWIERSDVTLDAEHAGWELRGGTYFGNLPCSVFDNRSLMRRK